MCFVKVTRSGIMLLIWVLLLSLMMATPGVAARKTVLHELSIGPPLCFIPAAERLLEMILDMPLWFRCVPPPSIHRP
jgi:hypothetical protein